MQMISVADLGSTRGKAAPIRVERTCIPDIAMEPSKRIMNWFSLVEKIVTTIKV
jgi:hypothetical protein